MKQIIIPLTIILATISCMPPQDKKEVAIAEKHNYIVLLDLSDRLIVQENQPERDKEIIGSIFSLFMNRVRSNMFIRSRDEFKVVIAQQRGSGLSYDEFEDKLYMNLDAYPVATKRIRIEEKQAQLPGILDTLYQEAVFSKNPKDFYGADIWKYFYEDLETDFSTDTLTKNFLFILTDGYPVVGKDIEKLEKVNKTFQDLKVILIEAAPRDKDMEWDRIRELWETWFAEMGITNYHFVKRMAISKEFDLIKDIVNK